MRSPDSGSVTAERWQQIKRIVSEALEQDSSEARAALVAERCAGDPDLLREVVSLLDQTTGALENFAEKAATPLRQGRSRLEAGRRMGPWAIVRELGRGGMGAVYLAERADGAFQKRVAIKVLKRGTDTDEILRRFEAERQILARLDHPNITRLIDAGTTDDGLPYVVMDYVVGQSITQYASEKELSVPDRLKLFRAVCSAVSYAHQNLVVHRDLKPSNILVTENGDVRLLDFGIAKLLTDAEAGGVDMTITALRVMTPEYASPEQIKGEPITTLSDVYSLGVCLYELLTGARPYKLTRKTPEELSKAICEQEPERPSTTAAKGDGSSKLQAPSSKGLRGDLDNIVLMALRKEPARRYPSVEQFSEDIRRHLEGLPVRARKDTAVYRATKFVLRHKIGLAAAVLIVLALTGGIIATTIQARRADRRFSEVRKLAHSVLFDYHDAIASLPGSTKVRERLVQDALEYLNNLSKETGNDTGLLAELATAYEKVGQIQGNSYYVNLGDTNGAISSYRTSLAIREKLFAANPSSRALQSQLADSLEGIGDMLYTIGDLRGGLENYERALDLREKAASAESGSVSYRIALSQLYMKIGDIKGMETYSNLGDTAGALISYRNADDILEPLIAADPESRELTTKLADVLTHVGMLSDVTGDVPSALATEQRAVKMLERLAVLDPNNQDFRTDLLTANAFLRYALVDNNQIPEAIENSRKIIAELEKMVKSDPNNTSARRNLGVTCNALGKDLLISRDVAGSLENHQRALTISEAILASDPSSEANKSDVAFTVQRLGEAQAAAGDQSSALLHYRKALALREATLAANPSNVRARDDVSTIYTDIGIALAATGQLEQAKDALDKAVSLAEQVSAGAPTNARARATLARRYSDRGKVLLQLAQVLAHSASNPKAEWERAGKDFRRSQTLWQELRDSGKLIPANLTKPDEVAAQIAKCDAAIK